VLPILASCDVLAPSAETGPGAFEVRLVSPAGEEGAAVFSISGVERLGQPFTAEGQVFSHLASEVTRVIAILDEPGQVRFRIPTEDVARFPTVNVLEVADGQNRLRESLSGYRVLIKKVQGRSSDMAEAGR